MTVLPSQEPSLLVPISIIVPSLNQADFLAQALDSILFQNYPRVEVIVADGGSTDRSIEILKSYGTKIRWVSEKDEGQSSALNKGFAMASYDVLGWLNSDDLYEPGALWAAGKFFAEHPETLWAVGDCAIIDENGKEIRKWISRYKSCRLKHFSFQNLLEENFIPQMGVFFRREILEKAGGVDPSLHYSMDYDLWLRFAKQFPPGILHARIGKFRMYPTSKSVAALEKQLAENVQIIKRYAPGKRWPLIVQRINIYKIRILYRLLAFLTGGVCPRDTKNLRPVSADENPVNMKFTVGVNTLFLIPGEVGGSETYFIRALSAMLEKFPSLGFVLFTQIENDGFLRNAFSKYQQVRFCQLRFKASSRVVRILREQLELPRKLRQYSVHLLWSPGYTEPFFAKGPRVVSILDMQYKNFPRDFSWLARRVLDLLIGLVPLQRSTVMTISEFSKREILKHTRIPEDRIFVTPLAASPDFARFFPEQNISGLTLQEISDFSPFLLCVSHTHPHKNLPALIRAFGKLPAQDPHQLVLVGKPARGEAEIQKAVRELPPGRKVIRLTDLPVEALATIYQKADLFIFPSLYEGFGLPVLEAMMAGTPVLTTRCASIPEVAGNAVSYFDPKDPADLLRQIERMLQMSLEERVALISRARRRAEDFSWGRTAEMIVRCFQVALKKQKDKQPQPEGRGIVSSERLPFVSVIILNFNGEKWLKECFESLERLNYPKNRFEVILGDNASTDGSVEYTQKNFPWIRIIRFNSNEGFCKPNNLCAKEAEGEYLIFLNNDTYVTPDWMMNLVQGIQSEKDIVLCSCKMLFPHAENGKRLNAAGGLFFTSGTAMEDGWMQKDDPEDTTPRYTGFGCGAGLLVRKKFFLETGGFDESFFYFVEDADLGWRAWVQGYKVLYVPSAVLYHYWGGTRSEGRKIVPESVFLLTRNTLYFILKNFEGPTVLRAFFFWHLKAMLRILYCLCHGNISVPFALAKGHFYFLRDIPGILKTRKRIQASRRVSDRELLRQKILISFTKEIRYQKSRLKRDREFYGGRCFYEKTGSLKIKKSPGGDWTFYKS